jgi:hypothetical protein
LLVKLDPHQLRSFFLDFQEQLGPPQSAFKRSLFLLKLLVLGHQGIDPMGLRPGLAWLQGPQKACRTGAAPFRESRGIQPFSTK